MSNLYAQNQDSDSDVGQLSKLTHKEQHLRASDVKKRLETTNENHNHTRNHRHLTGRKHFAQGQCVLVQLRSHPQPESVVLGVSAEDFRRKDLGLGFGF